MLVSRGEQTQGGRAGGAGRAGSQEQSVVRNNTRCFLDGSFSLPPGLYCCKAGFQAPETLVPSLFNPAQKQDRGWHPGGYSVLLCSMNDLRRNIFHDKNPKDAGMESDNKICRTCLHSLRVPRLFQTHRQVLPLSALFAHLAPSQKFPGPWAQGD